MKRNVKIMLSSLLILNLVGCSDVQDTVEDVAKEVSKEVEKEINSLDPKVGFVKNGSLDDYPNITVGDAFADFFGNPNWEYFVAETGESVVEFTGECMYQEVEVEANLQFIINDQDDTFEVGALSFNDVPQSELITNALLSKIFEPEEVVDGSGEEETEAVFEPKLGTSFDFGTPFETLVNALGDPIKDSYFLGGRLVTFESESYFLDDEGFVSGMLISDPDIPIFYVNVGMTVDEIASLLGDPIDAYYDDSDIGGYVTTYVTNGYEIWFVSESEDTPVDYAIVTPE